MRYLSGFRKTLILSLGNQRTDSQGIYLLLIACLIFSFWASVRPPAERDGVNPKGLTLPDDLPKGLTLPDDLPKGPGLGDTGKARKPNKEDVTSVPLETGLLSVVCFSISDCPPIGRRTSTIRRR